MDRILKSDPHVCGMQERQRRTQFRRGTMVRHQRSPVHESLAMQIHSLCPDSPTRKRTIPSIPLQNGTCVSFGVQVEGGARMSIEGFAFPILPPGCSDQMSVAERAAEISRRYPPRGGIQLLEAQHTHPDALDIDKVVVEEYILDTLLVYRNSRVDCVERIAQEIPSPFPVCPLVAQTLFSQLLLLPKPPMQPVTYASVIINLCKVAVRSVSAFSVCLSCL